MRKFTGYSLVITVEMQFPIDSAFVQPSFLYTLTTLRDRGSFMQKNSLIALGSGPFI
jgi:hypothetical protein